MVPPPAPGASQKWEVTFRQNPLDGAKRTTIASNRKGDRLIVRCGKRLHAYLMPWREDADPESIALRSDDGHAQWVTYRIDDSPKKAEKWPLSDHSEALVVPLQTIESLRVAKRMTVEYQIEHRRPRTATVSLDGLSDEMAKAECPSPAEPARQNGNSLIDDPPAAQTRP